MKCNVVYSEIVLMLHDCLVNRIILSRPNVFPDLKVICVIRLFFNTHVNNASVVNDF